MYKYSNLNTNSLLYSLLGAGLAGSGTYGLYKLLTPKKHQTTGLGLSATLLGALGGGALGYMKHEDIHKAMLAAAEKLQKSIKAKVEKQIQDSAPNRPVTMENGILHITN